MSIGLLKQTVFSNLAEVAQAMGHVHRLEILEYLAQGPRSVEELTARSKMSFANTSRHLQILRRAHLVQAQREGRHILYRLAGETEVVALLSTLGRVGERNISEIQRVLADYVDARDALEPITRKELRSLLKNGLITVLDVRPEDEFANGRIPGAVNIPIAELKRRLADLPKRQDVVAYCRGPYCVFSLDAVTTLRTRGFKARRLEDGYPEWKAAGMPVEG